MWKKTFNVGFVFLLFMGAFILLPRPSFASTQKHQFQLGTGFGVFVATEGLDASFDIDLEPEYFLTEHVSLSGRFDGMVGGTDGVHFGTRVRYYFNFPSHPRFSLYVGGGIGGMVVFANGSHGFGDIAIPVFGFQFDLTKHIKLGSDISFDIIFNGHNAAFGTRLQALQFKWVF